LKKAYFRQTYIEELTSQHLRPSTSGS